MNNLNFIESIKIAPDKEKEMLLSIQNKILANGISKETVLEITKNLSNNQKEKLKQLYIEQIQNLNFNTKQCKAKILKTKSNLEKIKSNSY